MTSDRPMTELYQRYRAGEVSFDQLKQKVAEATENYERLRQDGDTANKSAE